MCKMYSPRIKEELIPFLYREAKYRGKPMTHIVNDVIEKYFITVKCSKCLAVIELDAPSETAYCDYCESEVFVLKGN
jgi:hypothetical protein